MTTYLTMIVDKSGSMAPLASDTRGGFNAYIDKLREENKGKPVKATVALFDTVVHHLCVGVGLSKVPHLDGLNYFPTGATALLDAVGQAIDKLSEYFSEHGLRTKDRVLVIIQTDGLENSSTDYTREQVQKRITELEATGKWSFIYIGAGPDAWTQGQRLGFSNVVRRQNTRAHTHSTYGALAKGTTEYFKGRQDAATMSEDIQLALDDLDNGKAGSPKTGSENTEDAKK